MDHHHYCHCHQHCCHHIIIIRIKSEVRILNIRFLMFYGCVSEILFHIPKQNICHLHLQFIPNGTIDNKSSSVQVMVWCQKDDKQFPEPMLTNKPDVRWPHYVIMSWLISYTHALVTKWNVLHFFTMEIIPHCTFFCQDISVHHWQR